MRMVSETVMVTEWLRDQDGEEDDEDTPDRRTGDAGSGRPR